MKKDGKDPFLAVGYGGSLVVSPATGGGTSVVDYRPPLIYGRVTGAPTGYDYPWQQVNDMDSTLPNYTAANFALSGTATVIPFREINGNTSVPLGAVARGMLNQSQDAYLFSYGPQSNPQDRCAAHWLALPDCATLTLVEAVGSCECIDLGQTATLAKDSSGGLASEDLLYGCPPGVVTGSCPSGGPMTYNVTLSGGVGACAVYNGNWTLAYSEADSTATLDYYTGNIGGTTSRLLRSSAGYVNLDVDLDSFGPAYINTDVDCCDSASLTLDDGGLCGLDSPTTATITPSTACGNGLSYTPYIAIVDGDCGPCIRMRWIPSAGSGATSITFREVGCGEDSDGKPYIEFATASPLLCTDDAEECGENYLKVRVTCDTCFDAGWFCVWNGLLNVQQCEYLTDDPPLTSVILNGPHETDEDCSCETEYGSCCEEPMPAYFCATLTGTAYDGTYFVGTQAPKVVGGEFITAGVGCNGSLPNTFAFTLTQLESNGDDVLVVGIDLPGFCGTTFPYTAGGVTLTTDLSCIEDNCTTCLAGGTAVLEGYASGVPQPIYFKETEILLGNGYVGGRFTITTSPLFFIAFNFDGTTLTIDPSYFVVDSVTRVGDTIVAEFNDGVNDLILTLPATGVGCDDCNVTEVRYNCVNGECVAVYDGSGTYATEAECQSACEGGGGTCTQDDCCIENGDQAVLTIPDGTYAGDYYSVWNTAGTEYWVATFLLVGLGEVTISLEGPFQAVYYAIDGGGDGSGTYECNPLLITFDGADFGATGDVTVE